MDAKIKTITRSLIENLSKAESKDVSEVMKEFVNLLSERKMLGKWREVERAIHQVWKDIYGVSSITVVSAHPLTEEADGAIEKIAHGADITRRVDERLIGGSVIRIDDKRIDGSVTGNLQKLKMTLSK